MECCTNYLTVVPVEIRAYVFKTDYEQEKTRGWIFFLLQLGLGLGSLDINHNLSIIFANSGLFSDTNAPTTV